MYARSVSDIFIRKNSDGEWYVCRKTRAGYKRSGNVKASTRDWWMVKSSSTSQYICYFTKGTPLSCPKEFIGKRVRLKVEVLE